MELLASCSESQVPVSSQARPRPISSTHNWPSSRYLAIPIGDFQLTAGGGPHLPRPLHHGVVVEVGAGHGITGTGFGGFLLKAQHALARVEFHHAVALRIAHRIGLHGGAPAEALAGGQLGHQVVAMEQIVAQHQGGRCASQEGCADQEGLGQPIGAGLHRVVDLHPPGTAIPQARPSPSSRWKAG